jgi:eukaryotic-like serine/threonine-protein kinase
VIESIGPYRILGLIGAGGMGEVYRAHDPKLGRDVAIKVLGAGFLADPERLARFEREARALAALSHPHVGAIFGLEQGGDVNALVLELVEGPTLAEQLQGGPLTILQALTMARQIADALEAAHEKGIIHRDLKPANIKIGPRDTVKVLDFGLAKIEHAEADADLSQSPTITVAGTSAGVILGTAAYMSPEQARGRPIDKRTDIWSFGCVLYEMLAGRQAFGGETLSDAIATLLAREADWTCLHPDTPDAIVNLLQRCLEKDQQLRLPDIGEARRELDYAIAGLRSPGDSGRGRFARRRRATRAAPSRQLITVAAVLVVGVGAGLYFWRTPADVPTPLEPPIQLTTFTDSALAPALSPDGRMLTFIRGGRFGDSAVRGQIYVKILPTGEPVQLTRDQFTKEQPVFSADGSRIIYTAVTQGFRWDSWQVPVLGGAPRPFMPNASGLVWLDGRELMYSEIMSGVHMGIVTSNESRANVRPIYFPPGEGSMAHRSARSPDGRELLLVEMDGTGWLPCRLMPFDGSSSGRRVGPQGGQCTTAAWSPDGRWMFFSSSAGGGEFHIWRQRYPDGTPEPITSGPTEQEGTAITTDGRYLITSMGLQRAGIWLQDATGERELTAEGYSLMPVMGASGQRAFYLSRTGSSQAYASGELWSVDLATGERQRMLPGFVMSHYAISTDEARVVFASSGNERGDGVWIADLDRRTPPRQLTSDGAFRASFGAPGEIIYLSQGEIRHLYRMKEDGSARERVYPDPVNQLFAVSPDGQWAVTLTARRGAVGTEIRFVPLRGGAPFVVCSEDCAVGFGPNRVQAPIFNWSVDGTSVFVGLQYFGFRTARTVVLPYRTGVPLGTLWPKGLRTEQDVAANPGARVINDGNAFPAIGSAYLSWRATTQSNLYQIPLPR